MKCCKECLDLLYDYLEGGLDAETHAGLAEHFQDCPPCLAFLATYKTTSKLCRDTMGEVEVPDEVQIKIQEFVKEHIWKK